MRIFQLFLSVCLMAFSHLLFASDGQVADCIHKIHQLGFGPELQKINTGSGTIHGTASVGSFGSGFMVVTDNPQSLYPDLDAGPSDGYTVFYKDKRIDISSSGSCTTTSSGYTSALQSYDRMYPPSRAGELVRRLEEYSAEGATDDQRLIADHARRYCRDAAQEGLIPTSSNLYQFLSRARIIPRAGAAAGRGGSDPATVDSDAGTE